MDVADEDTNNIHDAKKSKKQRHTLEDNADKDYKEFLDEIEEDPEMRGNIMLFKVSFQFSEI